MRASALKAVCCWWSAAGVTEMHGLHEVRCEYDRLDKLLGIDTSGIELKVSSRAVKQLGSFRSPARAGAAPLRITLSKLVMEDDGLFLDTIRHEYAHAAAYLLYPGEKPGHGEKWKAICRRIGCTPKSRTKLSSEAAKQREAKAKYLVRCTGCGRETSYLRRGRTVELMLRGRGRLLRCTHCGGNDFRLLVRE